jgi:hypothetical protein
VPIVYVGVDVEPSHVSLSLVLVTSRLTRNAARLGSLQAQAAHFGSLVLWRVALQVRAKDGALHKKQWCTEVELWR